MVKIAFWENCLCERGTTIAVYDYAYYNKTLLGNESIIIYPGNSTSNKDDVVSKFEKEFKLFGVSDFAEVDAILDREECDMLYVISAGQNEGKVSKTKAKTVVHCIFYCHQPHGDVYASIAPWIRYNNGKYPTVPHMVHLPDHDRNMRSELGIPETATVFGRHGGFDQFDLPFVQRTVEKVAKEHPDIYFLFLNTKAFCQSLPNVIHLPMIIDLEKKVEFINSCDAMLWARSDGETFGLSIAEFSIKNKPIICSKLGHDKAHVHLLGDKGIWYTPDNLENILVSFDRDEMQKGDWNAYTDYTPEKVMQIFKKVFIDPLVD